MDLGTVLSVLGTGWAAWTSKMLWGLDRRLLRLEIKIGKTNSNGNGKKNGRPK